MHALLALAAAHTLDIARRPSTLVLGAVGFMLILSLRWFAAFGLGYEVTQLLELSVYTIGMLGAVAVVLFWLPREDEADDPELLLLTRPVSPWAIALGAFTGRLAIIALLCAFWLLSVLAALWWFQLEDTRLFSYRGAESPIDETATATTPVLGQLLATAVLLALAQPFARTRRPVVIAAAVLGLYVLGYAAGVPDLGRQDTTAALWGTPGAGISLWSVVHACAWCAVGIGLDSGVQRLRTVS